MSVVEAHISERAAELRQAFDRTFATTQNFEPAAVEDFLAIHVGGDPYMLRLSEVAGLYADKKVTGLPSSAAQLLGVAGFRGSIVPVYDLAGLLGYPLSRSARWLVMAAAKPVALAFEAFDGHFRFRHDAVATRPGEAREHIHQIVRADGAARSIVHLPSVIAALRT